MNTYLIPTTECYTHNYTYLTTVYANSPLQAKLIAQSLYEDRMIQETTDYINYESYNEELILPKLFLISKKDDIMSLAFKKSKEYKHMAFFNVNWNNYTEQISKIAASEDWSNITYPNNGILANYMVKTYNKLQSERNIIFTQDYALFNTGLFTKYHEPIYAYHSGTDILFLTDYELGSKGISERPNRANYFSKPELLLFDWHYPINVHYSHILEDTENKKRIPKDVLESDNIINILNGAIDTMKKKVSANYKLAIPQYFDGKIQLLLPLCLQSSSKPDLALVVTKVDNFYQGHTCLTLDMAYNNARLITKPESNWLSI